MKKHLQSPSLLACLMMAIVFIYTVFNIGNFKSWHSPISYDISNYYSYLPAIFVEHDLSLKFIDEHPEWYEQKFMPNTAPNGNHVIKMTMGLAFYYAPFFFVAHAYASLFDTPDGYSSPYRLLLLLSTVAYCMLGMWYLRTVLLRYFTEPVTALVLLTLGICTNLFYYTVHEPMSHAYLFFTFAFIMYLTIQWHNHPAWQTALKLGFFSGLAILIRPTDGLIVLVPLLYGVTSLKTFKEKMLLLFHHWQQIILLAIFMFIPLFFQMLYWKTITGQWIFFSYVGEGFLWKEPKIWDGLFSYQKGWLVYTPIISFGLLGIAVLWKFCRDFTLSIIIFTAINIYVVLSWWSWWYGGSFGLRSFIESYALLALPMGAIFQSLHKIRWSRYLLLLIIVLSGILNQIQTYQYRHYYIHWDSMSKNAYWYVFLKMNLNEDEKKHLQQLLVPPDQARYEKLKALQEADKNSKNQ